MLSSENIFVSPMKKKDIAGKAHKRFAHETGDHLTLLNIFEAYSKNVVGYQKKNGVGIIT